MACWDSRTPFREFQRGPVLFEAADPVFAGDGAAQGEGHPDQFRGSILEGCRGLVLARADRQGDQRVQVPVSGVGNGGDLHAEACLQRGERSHRPSAAGI